MCPCVKYTLSIMSCTCTIARECQVQISRSIQEPRITRMGVLTLREDAVHATAMPMARIRVASRSQRQMAKLMATSQQAISRIESGEYEGFTLKTLEKIAEATGTKVKIEFVAA